MADITPVVHAILNTIDRKIELAFQLHETPAGTFNAAAQKRTQELQTAVQTAVTQLTQTIEIYQSEQAGRAHAQGVANNL